MKRVLNIIGSVFGILVYVVIIIAAFALNFGSQASGQPLSFNEQPLEGPAPKSRPNLKSNNVKVEWGIQ